MNSNYGKRMEKLKVKFASAVRRLELEETTFHVLKDTVNLENIQIQDVLDTQIQIDYRVGTRSELLEIIESHPVLEARFDGYCLRVTQGDQVFPVWLRVTQGDWPFKALNTWCWYTTICGYITEIKVGCDELGAHIANDRLINNTGYTEQLQLSDGFLLYGLDECCWEDIL